MSNIHSVSSLFLLPPEGGLFAMCIFFVMSGYIYPMRPLTLQGAGRPDEARKNIASGCFCRMYSTWRSGNDCNDMQLAFV